MSVIGVVPLITTPLALLAFVVAAVLRVFDVDTYHLTPKQQYDIAMAQIHAREHGLMIISGVVCFLAILFVLMSIIFVVTSRSSVAGSNNGAVGSNPSALKLSYVGVTSGSPVYIVQNDGSKPGVIEGGLLRIDAKERTYQMNFDVQPDQAVVQPNSTERIALYFVRVDHDIKTTSFDLNQVPNYSCEFILYARESDGQPLIST